MKTVYNYFLDYGDNKQYIKITLEETMSMVSELHQVSWGDLTGQSPAWPAPCSKTWVFNEQGF